MDFCLCDQWIIFLVSESLAICPSMLLGTSLVSAHNSSSCGLSQGCQHTPRRRASWGSQSPMLSFLPACGQEAPELARFPLGLIPGRGTFSWRCLDKLSLAAKKWKKSQSRARSWGDRMRENIAFKIQCIRFLKILVLDPSFCGYKINY